MSQVGPDEDPAPPRRRRMWIAVAATLVAVPVVLLDNLGSDGVDDDPPTQVSRPLDTVRVPLDRPATGPPKGISVVTTSTTSSTVPITAATTTTRS